MTEDDIYEQAQKLFGITESEWVNEIEANTDLDTEEWAALLANKYGKPYNEVLAFVEVWEDGC